MKRYGLAILALSILTGGLTAYSSPPAEMKYEVPAMVQKKALTCADATVMPYEAVSFELKDCYLTSAVLEVQPVAVNAGYAVASFVSAENCSRPQWIGLAIRRCGKPHFDIVHFLVVVTQGHRLLHIDPGLC